MLESSPTTGSVETTHAEKRRLCAASTAFNAADPIFCRLFPELISGAPFTHPTSAAEAEAEPTSSADEPTAAPPGEGVGSAGGASRDIDIYRTDSNGLLDCGLLESAPF